MRNGAYCSLGIISLDVWILKVRLDQEKPRTGAGFFIFSVLPGGAVELPGRSRPAPGVVAIRRGLNVELSLPIFRLALAVFIPWRGADGFDRRAGWHPR